MQKRFRSGLTASEAKLMGLQALGFVASEADRLHRFLDLTGLDVAELRGFANEPATLAGVIEFLMQDESLMLSFAANHRLAPEDVSAAYRLLSGETGEDCDFD